MHNVDWRKGTPKPASPADRGRDITAEVDHIEIDGARNVETRFADCKHYTSAVPAEALQSLLAWAQAERPHIALVIVSGFLSNAAKDFLTDFERNNRPPFRIKYWEQPNIETLAQENGELLQRFFASGTPFTPSDAEHIEHCETAGCRHPAVYVNPSDPADAAQGLVRSVPGGCPSAGGRAARSRYPAPPQGRRPGGPVRSVRGLDAATAAEGGGGARDAGR